MKDLRNVRRMGAWVAACLLLRLLGGRLTEPIRTVLAQEEVAGFLLYLETGRVVTPTAPTETTAAATVPPQETLPPTTVPPETTPPTLSESQPLVLHQADTKTIRIKNSSGRTVSPEALLLAPLQWDLTQGTQVLLLHTHATESYTPTKAQTYQESSYYRTLEPEHNMLRIGERLAQRLTEGGVGVVHDRTLHDYPSYTGSYGNARKTLKHRLQQTPQLQLVLDLHRDALESDSGKQLPARITVDGKKVAQIMLVVGTDAGGLHHPNWQENLALALKLQNRLEAICPGICRYISLRKERFNQDLSKGAVLVEVGTAGNTLEESLAATEILAEAILSLARGTTADSTN